MVTRAVNFVLRLPLMWLFVLSLVTVFIGCAVLYSVKWVGKLITFEFKPTYVNNVEKRAAAVKLLGEFEVLILSWIDDDDTLSN